MLYPYLLARYPSTTLVINNDLMRIGWILYLASTVRSRFSVVSTPDEFGLAPLFSVDGAAGFKAAKLAQLREEDIVELLMLKLPESGAGITRDGHNDPLEVYGLNVKMVYHWSAFGFIDRFLEMKWKSPLKVDDGVVGDPALVSMYSSKDED